MIVFDLIGYIAHFRKYFSTTSSLSYAFPPRTTICGIVAGILGYDRDTYYEKLSSENCKIGLRMMTPVRKYVQTLNYLMTDESALSYFRRNFSWKSEPAQIRTELIMSEEHAISEIRYRIFFNHEDSGLMRELEDRLLVKKFSYPPSMGSMNNLAALFYVDRVEVEVFCPKGEVYVSTVMPISKVKLSPEKNLRIYVEELVPADFSADRKLKRRENYIYEGRGQPIKVSVNGEVFRCIVNGEEVIGLYM
jgi:CRISPR-associated protein Cas5h